MEEKEKEEWSLSKELKKIWYDTMTEEDGRYSRKSLTWFASFFCCMGMGIVDQFTPFKVNDMVFFGFLGMATGQSIASIFDKKITKK